MSLSCTTDSLGYNGVQTFTPRQLPLDTYPQTTASETSLPQDVYLWTHASFNRHPGQVPLINTMFNFRNFLKYRLN